MSVMGRQRPWVVMVADIGPTTTFATEERARARAQELTQEYLEVRVWNAAPGLVLPLRRWVYRPGRPVEAQELRQGRWVPR